MLDLYHATSDELIQIILDLRETFAERDCQIAALTVGLAVVQCVSSPSSLPRLGRSRSRRPTTIRRHGHPERDTGPQGG